MGDRLRLFFVTFGYLGLAPVAPGTFGTLGGVLIAWLLGMTSHFFIGTLVVCVVLYAIGRTLGDWAEAYGGKKDPGFYVVDEVIGYLVTILWLNSPSLVALTVAFIVFRFFDIFKPKLARRLERLGGGDGILLDDVVAGLYGLALMAVLRIFLMPEIWTAGA